MDRTPLEQRSLDAARTREAALAPQDRRSRGVVHTPPEIARFVARAVDFVLRRELGLARGLAHETLRVIDPACGTGAFLAAALAAMEDPERCPSRMLGIDRDRTAVDLAKQVLVPACARIELACADVLATPPDALSSAARVLVALGNPPWVTAAQAEPEPWLSAVLEEARHEAGGQRMTERKLGVLADAYVRFLCWALALARGSKDGAVIGFVTNGSYLDGPVHRGLRALLLRELDELFVIDLGGSALLARDRAEPRDGNVFGVRTSVAILIGVRRGPAARGALGSVRYARMHGSSEHKLEALARAQLDELSFVRLVPSSPAFRLVPTHSASPEYASWPSLAELMPFHREGVQSNRDAFVIDTDAERLLARLTAFARGEHLDAVASRALSHYDPERAREAVREALEREGRMLLRRLAYRPFDTRYFAPVAPLCHRPRPDLLAAQARSSFALVTVGKDRSAVRWRHVAVTRDPVDSSFLSTRSSCRTRAFPTHDPHGRANVAPELLAKLAERAECALEVEDLTLYVLGALSDPSIQRAHGEALRLGLPRVPWPQSASGFARVLAYGGALAAALLEPIAVGSHAPSHARDPGAAPSASVLLRDAPAVARECLLGHQRVLFRALSGRPDDRQSAAWVAALSSRIEALALLLERGP